MPLLQRPRREPRARCPARRPAFARIQLRDAWEHVQTLAQSRQAVGLIGSKSAPQLLDELRQRLPAFLQPRGVPDRSRLSSVESFFRYTEEEGATCRPCAAHACGTCLTPHGAQASASSRS